MIDLRSDTVTRPTPEMLAYMMKAQTGDDVFEEDPTVIELQAKTAQLFGKEDALFCPSGTMTNQVAIKVLTRPTQEVICDSGSHVYYYEGGGMMFNSGVSVKLINGNRGRITSQEIMENINADNVHFPETILVVLENSANRGGGSCYKMEDIEKIANVCKERNLKIHLDGARIFNACIAQNYTPEQVGKYFDTISVCLSKGLGAPVGSLVVSTKENIKKARRIRKVFGGGMRQAGYIAAAGLYALENNMERLEDDHKRAGEIEKVLISLNYVQEVIPVETNIVIFKLKESMPAEKFLEKLSENNIKAFSTGKQLIRFVTHLDFTDAMLGIVIEVLKKMNN